MNQKITLSIVVGLLLLSCFTIPSVVSEEKILLQGYQTLYVGGSGPNNYTMIQDAIDNASCGDTVYVYNGTYYENIKVNKSIQLIGENKYQTIIDGSKGLIGKAIVNVTAEYIKFSRFTIQNSRGIDGRAMIVLKNGGFGYSRNNDITENIVKNCTYGVMIINPKNNVITNNSLYGCGIGPYITIRPIFNNYFYDNTVNDKPVLFYLRKNNFCVDGEEVGSIGLFNCRNVKICNLNISNVTVGIGISFSSKITVVNNTISNTGRGGIYVHHSRRCKFIGNTFINDNWGIFLRRSHLNRIKNNNFINISMPDWFASSYLNNWNGNYWGEPTSIPKKIEGRIGLSENITWYNFDWRPSQNPIENSNAVK